MEGGVDTDGKGEEVEGETTTRYKTRETEEEKDA